MNLLLVAGARPNFMKVAPIIKAIQKHNARSQSSAEIAWKLVHTGQHYDEKMSHIFFAELGIPTPEINLEVGSGSHAVQTANILIKFEPVCLQEKPDWVVVVGDINSTMACTLVAAKVGIKVAHVEAGLRSFDRTMPEEINRLVTDAISDLLLTPSEDAGENLKREGVAPEKIRLVGNIMIDSLIANLDQARQRKILESLDLPKDAFTYVTLHRPSNVDDPVRLERIVRELDRLAEEMPVVFPVHPRTRNRLQEFGVKGGHKTNLRVIDPIGYHDSLALTENARLVLTDSGGLQEESTFFRTPCLTLRPNTERPVTITEGSNKLVSVESLRKDLETVLQAPRRLGSVPRFWDGSSASRILDALLEKS